ncbi:MAG: PilZ domain-containing protein [Syntrophaceae bacterium]|nr:PilZ domain-containing protein [Syntrophaceae bacterium]
MSDYDLRKYIRYPAEPNELVTVYYLDEKNKKTGQRLGIGENESFQGCCVVFVGEVNFKKGQEVLCQCGTLPKVKARVVWIKKLENEITKMGISFL